MKLRGLAFLGSLAALALAVACADDSAGTGAVAPSAGAAGTGGARGLGGEGGNDSALGGAAGEGDAATVLHDAQPGDAGMAGQGIALAPTLLSETPAPGADNVWLFDPIVLVFSEALDQATVNDAAFSLVVAGNELQKSITLSDDATTVTLRVSAAPITPNALTLDVKDSIRSVAGLAFAGTSLSWQCPLWQVLGSSAGAPVTAAMAAVALDVNDQPFIAALEKSSAPNPLRVSSWDGSAWHNLGDALNVDPSLAASAPSLVVGSDGNPVVAWGEPTSNGPGNVYVAAFAGKAWSLLGGSALGTSASPVELALDSKGQPVAAWLASPTKLSVQRFTNGAWQALGTPLTLTADLFHGFGFALSGDRPVVAYYDVNQDLAVKSWAGASWSALGGVIDRARTTSSGRPSIAAASDGTLFVGYVDGDALSGNGYVRSLPKAGTSWVAEDGALDVQLDAEVTSVDVRASASGPIASWLETYGGKSQVYTGRLAQSEFQALGPGLSASPLPLTPGGALALDSHGNATVVYQGASELALARYNGSPELPYGLSERVSTAACVIPKDTSPDFPQTLSATGCYSDLASRTVIAGAVPYDLNSPLWSDGAIKHRYIVLPDGATIGYTDTGGWDMPVGTIVIKEFGYLAEATDPASVFPMETRFLVKRCEEGQAGCAIATAWQGYSYQWNAAGTEATLLPGTALVTKAWPFTTNGTAAAHTHTYPARSQCLECHNTSVGRVLGIQTAQLNRSHDYGETVDNELRAFDHIGLFGDTFPTTGLDQIPRLPTPNDPGFPIAARARAYFHANCSHCHNPSGECPQIDFRFYGTGLTAGNICNELVVGSSATSKLYLFDANRDATKGLQMPPLATLIPDARELPITASWIDTMKSCP